MKATIITDASVNAKTRNATGAFYIGCKLGKIQKVQVLKVKTNSSNTAELHTITNAIYTLSRSKWEGIKQVEIYSDNLHTCKALNGIKNHVGIDLKALEEVRFLMYEFCFRQGLDIRTADKVFKFIHIRAHTGAADKHSVIQDWCDSEAKALRVLADENRLK